MMKFYLQNVTHSEFFKQLEKHEVAIKHVLSLDGNDLKELVDEEIKKNKKYISRHLAPDPKPALYLLQDVYSDVFDDFYSSHTRNKSPEAVMEIKRMDRFYKSLNLMTGYLSVVDSLADPEVEMSIEGINEKTDFVLQKLLALFGDEFYSISALLEFNDITYRDGETREIAEDLKRRGYVILKEEYRHSSDDVKISVKGAAYIERKNKQKSKKKENNVLNQKIDSIIKHLTNLGLGQEILFEEMEELKTLQHSLSKKSWSQVLKGKLLELTVDKIISAETADFICEQLTNGSFKLLQ